MSVDGIVNFNKLEGETSFGVVSWLKRLTGEKRVGHAGTLDPMASGVLPICFGLGTRVIEFLMDHDKTYLGEIELGVSTDTFDKAGNVIQRSDPNGIRRDRVEEALASFQGTIEQVPPVYSALKYRGKRYCDLARGGVQITPKPRLVHIFSLELVDFCLPTVTVRVKCGKGTYIRSLAHDMGQYLGCGAHLKKLVRLQCGPFCLDDAVSKSQFAEAFREGTWKDFLRSVDSPLLNWEAAIVADEKARAIRNGCPLTLGGAYPLSGDYCRAYGVDGRFMAVLRFVGEKQLWHPVKVFSN